MVFVLHHLHSGRAVACGDAVVDQGLALPIGVPLVDVVRTLFGVQHRGDPVQGSKAVIQVIFPVAVDVDQAWRDNQSAGIDGLCALQRTIADGLDVPPTMPTWAIRSSPFQDP